MSQQYQKQFKTPIVPLLIIGSLFFIFGFVSWVNAILIPYFKIACELSHIQAYLVTLSFYIAYLVMAIPASWLLNRYGFKKGMMIGLWCMSLGTLFFVPAALTRTYGIFLIGLFAIGTGLSILQTAANPYVTVIGPIDSAAKRISIMGLCNKFAGIISPLIFAAVILKSTDSELFAQLNNGVLIGVAREAALDELIRRVIFPYTVLSLFLFLFGILIKKSSLPEIEPEKQNNSETSAKSRSSVLQYPYLVLGVLAIFFHVGSQVIAIDTIIGYAQFMGMDLIEAKAFPSYTMTCTLIGYFIGVLLIPRVLSQRTALQICTVLGMLFSLCVLLLDFNVDILGHQSNVSIWFLCLMGLPNALIYAGIWPLAIHGLGKFTNLGSSMMVMALCGNAFLPMIYGYFADQLGARMAYWILIPCFLYLIFFSFKGYKIEKW
jgi:glucose/galactose transporter WARNING